MNSIKGYFQALKDVTWPKSKNVMKFFGVTLFAIVLLTIILAVMDSVIKYVISFLYA